jgi:hypothetical protein
MAATYHEIVVKGDGKVLKGFVRGFQIGRSIASGLCVCGETAINRDHLKHLHVGRGDCIHLVCTTAIRERILAAIEEATELELEVVFAEKIFRSYFEFEFETFSRDAAKLIKKLVDPPPGGLELVDYSPEETVDEKARGVELYSPVHEYRFAGKGKIDGVIEPLISVHSALGANEFVTVREIRIEHAR